MQPTTLSGAGSMITVDGAGVSIRDSLYGRVKAIPWTEVGGATIRPRTWLLRARLVVLTRRELGFAAAQPKLLEAAAARAASEWQVGVPDGEERTFEALANAINREAARRTVRTGASVRVASRGGERQAGTVGGVAGENVLVLFPNGSERWFARATVELA